MLIPTQVPETDPAAVDRCGEDPSWICRWVVERTDSELTAQFAEFFVARPLNILFIIFLAFVATRLARRGIKRMMFRIAEAPVESLGSIRRFTPAVLAPTTTINLRAASRAETLGGVLRSTSSALIWGFAILMILGELSINLGPLIAGAGIAGVALGFGAQSLVKDFLTGMFMLLEDQYGVGDIIDVGEAVGEVEAVTLRTTKLRGLDGSVWHVPNGEILRVGNLSQEWSRALLDVDVAYGTDLEHARQVIERVADEVFRDPDWTTVILEPPEIWGIERLGADGVAIRLVVKTKPGLQWGLQRELRRRLKDTFDTEGIEIPFPQRSVWFRSDGAADADDISPTPPTEPESPRAPRGPEPPQEPIDVGGDGEG